MTPQTFKVSVNPWFPGKVEKGSPLWGAFNGCFEIKTLTLDEIAAHIRKGHALTAVHHTYRKTANFIERSDLGADFDTEDERSKLDTLQGKPFIAQFAAMMNTTSSHTSEKPRARVTFLLDQPITDPKRYREYAQALIWSFGGTLDEKCKDPARVWFGSLNCELRLLGNILPCVVMDDLVKRWKAAQPAPEPKLAREPKQVSSLAQPEWKALTLPAVPEANALELLDRAVREAKQGNRNDTGFWLACQLRDRGYATEQASAVLLDYHAAVAHLPADHPYHVCEVEDTLKSVYSRKPRVNRLDVYAKIDAVAYAAVAGQIDGLSPNMKKTLFGVLALMRQGGKVSHVHASARSVAHACFGFVPPSSIDRHLDRLVEIGVLEVSKKSNQRKGNAYNLLVNLPDKMGHSQQGGGGINYLPPAMNVPFCPVDEMAKTYEELQSEPLCAMRAQFHPRMARNEEEARHSFGSSVQEILTVLATLPDGQWIDSLGTLAEIAHVSVKTVSRKVSYLESHRIVKTDMDGNQKRVRLTDDWYENMVKLLPALTSFGQDILRKRQSAIQQIEYHAHMAKFTNNQEKKEESLSVVANAQVRLAATEGEQEAANQQRQQWMADNGMDPVAAPPISLHPRSNPKPHKPVIHVNGHNLTPGETAKVKPNGKIKAERTQQIVDQLIQADIEKREPVTGRTILRFYFGSPRDEKFGTVEQVQV